MKYSKVIIMIIKYSLYLLWFHFGSSLPKLMWNLIALIMMRFGGNFKRPLVHEESALMKGLKQSCRSEWVLISRKMKLITMRMDCYKAMPRLLMFCVFHECFLAPSVFLPCYEGLDPQQNLPDEATQSWTS